MLIMAPTSWRILQFAAALAVVATILSAAHAQDESEWLAAHNEARSDVGAAFGADPVSVEPLVWNATLAEYAMGWVQQQTGRFDCPTLYHSGTEIYGENNAYGNESSTPTTAVAEWVSERVWFHPVEQYCDPPANGTCEHYTQVVWNTTTSLGCASGECRAGGRAIYYVCSYYPRGNTPGERPY